MTEINLYLSQYMGVDSAVFTEYGAFNVSVATDLPIFIDPFLLFHSSKPEYQKLHEKILTYLRFLRDKAANGNLDPDLISLWFTFKEVKQNWLGFTVLGNGGHGLGIDFAKNLHDSLHTIFSNFGGESITRSSHLEKVGLIRGKVGRDSISDFTTNLIKEYLLEYTQEFARRYLDSTKCRKFRVRRVRFNYDTEAWEDDIYYLPVLWNDFVLLTPIDMLTRDETWISRNDLFNDFSRISAALPNAELRAQVSNYFSRQLIGEPSKKARDAAIEATLRKYPAILDYYIREKEEDGDQAEVSSLQKVEEVVEALVKRVVQMVDDLSAKTGFYTLGLSSYDEALARARYFKHYIEDRDGWQLINKRGKAFAKEPDVQLFFGLVWFASVFDVNREVNNGRGPVDFKVSIGANEKALIEFKLGSNTKLKQNLVKQLEIYEKANGTSQSIKVIVCYTKAQWERVEKILRELGMANREDVVIIDARADNKPSASIAK